MPASTSPDGVPVPLAPVEHPRAAVGASPTRAAAGHARDATAEGAAGIGRTALWLCAGSGLLAAALFWLVRGALIDDAYITLSYARNLAEDLHWGLVPDEPANSATSPLNVLLLAAAAALLRPAGGDAVWSLGLVTVGLAAAMAWGWVRIAAALRLPPLAPALGLALVLLNPLVLSSAGLEVLLVPALLVGLLAAATRGRPVAYGLLAGLAVLARLDLVVFVVPLALAAAGVRLRLPASVAAAVAVALPWFAWSWWRFGSAIPDTFAIKTLQRSFGPWTFGNGPLDLYHREAAMTVVAFLPAALGLLAVAGWGAARLLRPGRVPPGTAPAAALGAAGVAYYAVYALLGVPPYQWYYVPTLAALSIALCALAGAAFGAGPAARRALALPGLALAAVLAAASLVVDVRDGVPWRTPVIFGNWATAADYARIGRELGERVGPEAVESPGEIGTLAYFCRCAIVDAFADRSRALPLIEDRIAAAGPLTRPLLELNYLRLDRDQQPRPARYRLVHEPGPATQPGEWEARTSTTRVGHFRLEEKPPG